MPPIVLVEAPFTPTTPGDGVRGSRPHRIAGTKIPRPAPGTTWGMFLEGQGVGSAPPSGASQCQSFFSIMPRPQPASTRVPSSLLPAARGGAALIPATRTLVPRSGAGLINEDPLTAIRH